MSSSLFRRALLLGVSVFATLTVSAQNISPYYNPFVTTTHTYQTLLSLNNDLYGGTAGTAAANDCSGTPPTFMGQNVIYVSPTGSDFGTGSSSNPLQTGKGANDMVASRQSSNPNGPAGQLVCFLSGTYTPFSITQSGKSYTDLVRFEVVPGMIAKIDVTCGGDPTCSALYGLQIVPPARFGTPGAANYVRYVLASGFYVQGPDELLNANGTDSINPGNGANYYNSTCIQINGNQSGSNYVANQEADHIYIVANTAVGCPGGGIGASFADYVTIDGNTVYDNNWYGVYGGSAIALGYSLDTKPTDTLYLNSSGYTFKNYIVNNTVFNNIQFLQAQAGSGFSPAGSLNDGEGIVIDTNLNSAVKPDLIPGGTIAPYSCYTLISGNQVWGNGSNGIEATYSQNIVISFNTLFNNGVNPSELNRAEIEDYDSLNITVASNLIYTGWDTSFGQGFDGGPNGVTAYYDTYYGGPYYYLGTVHFDNNTALSNENLPLNLLTNYPPEMTNDNGDNKFQFVNNAYAYGYTTSTPPYFAEYATPTDSVYGKGLAVVATSDPYIQNSTRYLSLQYDILGRQKPSTTSTVAVGAFNVAY